MADLTEKYGPEVQYVTTNHPLEDILYLMKRDGAVFIRNFVSDNDVEQAHADVKDRLDEAPEWNGTFYPSKSNSLIHDKETVCAIMCGNLGIGKA